MNTRDESNSETQARAQVQSIVAMVKATTVDYDQLEELRDKRAGGCWSAGFNLPGYMPDSEPAAFDTCDEARGYIVDELRNEADGTESDADAAPMLDAAETLQEMVSTPDAEFGQTIGAYHYWISFQPNTLADQNEAKELAELEEAANDCEDEDSAWEAIEEDPLSVEVRSGWVNPGEDMTPEEFRIVLCTGDPHVELQGARDTYGSVHAVRVIHRGWGTCGELFDLDDEERQALQTYCERFFAG